MNKKEITEIKKRLKPEHNNIGHIYGCYFNSKKEIISVFDESTASMSKEEEEKYITLLKKSLSGSIGKNLVDLSFTTRQVMDSDEHRMLTAMRRTRLADPEVMNTFYKCITENLNTEDDCNYLALLAFDSYDVPKWDKNGEETESSEVFNYILCALCPVKNGKPALAFSKEDDRFTVLNLTQMVMPPVLGFMFPAFDDRAANIYSALFYSKDTKGSHEDFIDAVFKTEVPMPAARQQEEFGSAVRETLQKECTFDAVQNVHAELRNRIEAHKESKDPDALELTYEEAADILEKSGMSGEMRESFVEDCKERFGEKSILAPDNIINSKRFEIVTENAKIQIDPQYSSLVKTRIIDGHKYILIPVEAGAEVNGISIDI